ncbi:MAG TPA: hypothetical protein VKY39_01390 [Aggregatilineales bacterium]|nr:hypothetical protein [Aggregatilineales bacterium]
MVKLLMTWDIQDGRDADYFEFVVREWVPGITKLGLQPTEAWYTLYGDCPQVLTGGIAEDLSTMRGILASEEWELLLGKLEQYVENYQQKIVPATGNLQLF